MMHLPDAVDDRRMVEFFPSHDEPNSMHKEREYRFSGLADRIKFTSHVGPRDRVLDFGCRGGHMLANLECGERLGIEPHPAWRQACGHVGVTAVASIEEVRDHWADVLISHHALEHVTTPYEVLLRLRRKVRPGGNVVFVVPSESVTTPSDPGHLFTWSPANLANLFTCAGYRVLSSRAYYHRWPPKGEFLQRWLGWKAFHALSVIHGRLRTSVSQSIVVATPPD